MSLGEQLMRDSERDRQVELQADQAFDMNGWKVESCCPTSVELVRSMPSRSIIADIGCHGWLLAEAVHATEGVSLIGVDRSEPSGRPEHASFAKCSDSAIDLPDDSCDLVVAGHVLEHVVDGVAFIREMLRIVRPGGRLWIETPSEISCIGTSADDPESHRFLTFWDDPTHVRPWPPGALYRAAISCQAVPVAIQRRQTNGIPCATMLARKPSFVHGRPSTRYVALKGVPYGVRAAYEAIWGEK
jgi:SAM-dependent methyltransferase